jgi:hypothetical protein
MYGQTTWVQRFEVLMRSAVVKKNGGPAKNGAKKVNVDSRTSEGPKTVAGRNVDYLEYWNGLTTWEQRIEASKTNGGPKMSETPKTVDSMKNVWC